MDTQAALEAFRRVDFQWVIHIDSVWSDLEHHIPHLHKELRDEIVEYLQDMRASSDPRSPLGKVIVGSAGLGKTHLLSSLRQEALQYGVSFVLVDMSGVRDFWATTLLGYIDSLQKEEPSGRTQCQHLIHELVQASHAKIDAEALTRSHPPKLINQIDELVRAMSRSHQRELLRHQDVLRALILLGSEDFDLATMGHAWLQGHGLGEEEMLKYGFRWPQKEPREVVQGLSWLMSLRGPTLLALDQVDAIVSEHHHLASQPDNETHTQMQISRQIIEGLGHGLMSLRDLTRRTLLLVSCIEATWDTLRNTALRTTEDRFEPPCPLGKVTGGEMAEQLVLKRLELRYRAAGFVPPYPTWPFPRPAFQTADQMSPRRILRRCDQHRRACIAARAVTELPSFVEQKSEQQPPPADHQRFDNELVQRLGGAAPDLTEEEKLGQWLAQACHILKAERNKPADIYIYVDEQFPAQRNSSLPPLHARIRLLLNIEAANEREQHFCIRVIEQTHHLAYQARLRAALTASGIDVHLQKFRHLMVVRTQAPPSGTKTAELTRQLTTAGGQLVPFPPEERHKVWVLVQMYTEHSPEPDFIAWLHERKPASQLAVLKPLADWLDQGLQQSSRAGQPAESAASQPKPAGVSPKTTTPGVGEKVLVTEGPVARSTLPIGRQVIGDKPGEERSLAPLVLAKHTVILAGSGSGKTVLVRRIVEEAALLGIPSIVIDGANDLARLGDRWPQRPDAWSDEDHHKAEHYHQRADVLVWTPGRPSGNPVVLAPLPDFSAVAKDSEELEQMVLMATESLGEMVAAGASETARVRRGVLSGALRYFATHGAGMMSDFIELLKDLPDEAGAGISRAGDHATRIADLLLASLQGNPLLAHDGQPLDPGLLYGRDGTGDKTRISVLNLVGLPSLAMQQQFVNQLAMTLFAWIKKHPGTVARPMTGLLVVDEAKDFIPSQSNTACKSSLLRLVAQGRKYGLGLIFATQAPRSIDHNVIANCTTQFFGKASSPAAIEAVQEQLRLRGASGADVPRLPRGRFYFYTEGVTAPVKLDTPLCLSYHPSNPLDETEVLGRAQQARRRLGR